MRDEDNTDIPEEPIKNFGHPDRHVKRMQDLARVESRRFVGKRGGIRDPIAIVWRTHGTGLFRHVEKGTGKTALFPWVKYSNGKGSVRLVRADEWRDWAERWLPVVGHECCYEVSDHGRVRSVDRVVVCRGRWGIMSRRTRGRVLSLRPNPKGRLAVNLAWQGRKVNTEVQRLVLLAFVGACPPGMECCHWDGNPANNRLGNLRWDTRRANAMDKVRHGTDKRGEQVPTARLTVARVREARRLHAAGTTCRLIAGRYGVSESAILNAVSGKTWAHIGGPAMTSLRARGMHNGRVRLTPAMVREIRQLSAVGQSQRRIARQMHVGRGAVRSVLIGRTWRHVE